MRKIVSIVLLCFTVLSGYAQQTDSSAFRFPIQMDTIVVQAARRGWDVNAFIYRVQHDTTFYKAFRSMNLFPYTATNDIKVLDKNGDVKASLYSHTRQEVHKGCRSTKVLDEKTTGDFYNWRHNYNYYTAELYAYLFFTKGVECGGSDIVAEDLEVRGKGKMEKAKWQLKQLVFNPGAKISGIPFIGNKASLFDPEIAKYYDFKLMSEEYNGQDCYVFKATLKKGEESKGVFNDLTTWFRKSDYSIVARDYSLSYSTMLYDFNVVMKVRTQQIGHTLLPVSINYDGDWHVFTKKRERVKFTATIHYL